MSLSRRPGEADQRIDNGYDRGIRIDRDTNERNGRKFENLKIVP